MKNGKIAPPGYVLPNRPRWQGGWNIRSIVGAAIAFAATASAATEWLTVQLNNPVEMGNPILWVRGTAIFQPFAALVLWKHYAGSRLISSGVRKDLWFAFAATIVGGVFLAYFTYWFLSLIRDRKSTDSLMNLHGSATWATREDIEKIGLLDATDGVYVGGWRDPRLRKFSTYCIRAQSQSCSSLRAEAARAFPPSFRRYASGDRASLSMTSRVKIGTTPPASATPSDSVS